MNDLKAIRIVKDFERLKSERATYESAWRDIRDYVRPNVVDFNAHRSPGDIRTVQMLDSTAMQANTDLASEVFSNLFNPSERTFGIGVNGSAELNRDPEVIEWCDLIADELFFSFTDERSQHTSATHEIIQDITAFGNGVISQEWNSETWQLQFMARPLACSFFDTDANGVVNKLIREESMELRQIVAKWPGATWEGLQKELESTPEKKYCVLHSVQPRAEEERRFGSTYVKRMIFASCWVLKEKKLLLDEGGYESFPYHCPRWNKVADEIYGRGPGINCIPAVKMLNRQKLTTIKAAQKATDPPIWLPGEGVRLPYRDEPGGVNFYDPSMFPQGFPTFTQDHKGNFPVTLEMMESERADIRKAFYTDWMEWFPKRERQTAQEIRELSMRKLNKMSPLLGRLETELQVPMIQRAFELKRAAGLIPDAPTILQGGNGKKPSELKVIYVSASARAQAASEANSIMLFFQELLPWAQADPTVMDAINMPEAVQELAIKQRITRRILRSKEEITAMQEQRAQKEQAMQMAGAAEPISKAVLNIAKANEAGGIAA